MSGSVGAPTPYKAPLEEILTALHVAGLDELLALPTFAHVDVDTIASLLQEFARLAEGEIARGDRVGDAHGAVLDTTTHTVTVPDEFAKAYTKYVEGGWGALSIPEEFGGGGFPAVTSSVIQEFFASANMALSLNPVLTQGSIEALIQWGTSDEQALFLPKLMTGEWSGTMNLTEPQAGSDLGAIRTIATPNSDGTWAISGTKIFITWGEHELAENIIHLVLARTPDAASGSKGLSVFLVPKYEVHSDGALGKCNSLRAQSLEHKLGIHASPTCVMEFDNATGFLVGPLHGGMKVMFTMMNNARLAIGVQGPATAERAFQHAYDYACNREQGNAGKAGVPGSSHIIEHPDVQRMLALMNTSTIAARLMIFTAVVQKDIAHYGTSEESRQKAQFMVDLLTPIAKAWSTDRGFEATSLAVQVFGGAGFIEESGIAQRLRDARIAPIYEGTNGIQSLDLVFRKIPAQGGTRVQTLFDEMSAALENLSRATGLTASAERVQTGLNTLRATTSWMLQAVQNAPRDAQAGATAYLELFGAVYGGLLMLQRATLDAPNQEIKILEAEFFVLEFVLPSVAKAAAITSGAARLGALAR